MGVQGSNVDRPTAMNSGGNSLAVALGFISPIPSTKSLIPWAYASKNS